MKLVLLKNNFREGLEKVGGAITQKDNLPVLRNVLLQTQEGKLMLSSTNLEMGISVLVSGKISEEGGMSVPFQTISNIVTNIENEKISLETKNTTLVIKTDNYEAKIQGTKTEDFPILPSTENKHSIDINGKTLKEAINSIISAARVSEIRPELSGVLFDFQITLLKIVATDSFRLAEKTIYEKEFKTAIPRGLKVIVPIDAIHQALRIINDKDIVRIVFDVHQILFYSGETMLISRLIDGTYPDYEQIVPKTIETTLDIDKSQFLQSIKLVASFSGKSHDITLRLKEGKKALEVYSSNPALGENSYLVPVRCRSGEAFHNLAFNWRYMIDGIKALRGEKMILGINNETKPALIRSDDDPSYFYIIMPIRL